MPVNPSGDSIYDGDCLKAKCKSWGGDNCCILSIEYTIYGHKIYDIKRSFWDHLRWKLFVREQNWFDWHISLIEHLFGKLRIRYPKEPWEFVDPPFCPLDSEFREEWEDPNYEDHWEDLYNPLNY